MADVAQSHITRGRGELRGLRESWLAVPCPCCSFELDVPLGRVIGQAGLYCPCCRTYLSFADSGAALAKADRDLRAFLDGLGRTIEVRLEL